MLNAEYGIASDLSKNLEDGPKKLNFILNVAFQRLCAIGGSPLRKETNLM